MTNKTYDTLKWIAMILLPAIATLYFALAGIWGFPYPNEVVGTITAIDTFLGVILGISSSKYIPPSDGKFIVKPGEGGDAYSLDFGDTLENLADKDQVVLDVTKPEV